MERAVAGPVEFEGQVALVTGSGRGLGRAYALELARRGARIVINDLPGQDGDVAEQTAAEIRAMGGDAIASTASVTDEDQVAAMVAQAIARWGRIDVLIANAGFLDDKPFADMSIADFRAVLDVHLMGTVIPVKAVWAGMLARGYGRIVTTTSGVGLYGRATQSNYAAAKMGVVGFSNAIRLEGEAHGIRVNAISPIAATRMTAALMTPERLARIDVAYVAPAMAFLASRDAPNGVVLTAGAGAFTSTTVEETVPFVIDAGAITAERVRDSWERIADPRSRRGFDGCAGHAKAFFGALEDQAAAAAESSTMQAPTAGREMETDDVE